MKRFVFVAVSCVLLAACQTWTRPGYIPPSEFLIAYHPELPADQQYLDAISCVHKANSAGLGATGPAQNYLVYGGGSFSSFSTGGYTDLNIRQLLARDNEGWNGESTAKTVFRYCLQEKEYLFIGLKERDEARLYYKAIDRYDWENTPLAEVLERPSVLSALDWYRVKREGTRESYQAFLLNHPDHPREAEARLALQKLETPGERIQRIQEFSMYTVRTKWIKGLDETGWLAGSESGEAEACEIQAEVSANLFIQDGYAQGYLKAPNGKQFSLSGYLEASGKLVIVTQWPEADPIQIEFFTKTRSKFSGTIESASTSRCGQSALLTAKNDVLDKPDNKELEAWIGGPTRPVEDIAQELGLVQNIPLGS